MSNKTYITDDHNLNDSSIAASSKAISNGLSALMDNIIVAANAAANSQTTIPNNNAVELSNRIEQVAAKNTEQDAAISAAQSSADAALPHVRGTMSGSLLFDDNSGIEYSPQPYKGLKIFSAENTIRLLDSDSEQFPSSIMLQTPQQLTEISRDGGLFSNSYSVLLSVNGYGAIDRTGACKLPVGIPTTQYVDLNSAAVYTAPADGFVIFTGTVNNTESSRLAIAVNGTALYAVNNTTGFSAGNPISCWLPVQKNMSVSFSSYNVTSTVCRFYYSLGAI